MLSEPKKTEMEKSKSKSADKLKDYGNEPYLLRKRTSLKSFLEKHGFPKELLVKK